MNYRNVGRRAKQTLQTEPIIGSNQQPNHGGGYSYVLDDMARFKRFLILGSAGSTYYSTPRKLTKENLECLERLLAAGRGKAVIDLIVEISVARRAVNNDQALFALARCCACDVHGEILVTTPEHQTYRLHADHHPELARRFQQNDGKPYVSKDGKKVWKREGDAMLLTVQKGAKQVKQIHPLDLEVRRYAYDALNKVARTGTHFLHFQGFIEQFRGRGAMHQKATNAWYEQKTLPQIVYQVLKYQNRDGWAQRDILRLLHPKSADAARNELYHWITKGEIALENADQITQIEVSAAPELAAMVPFDGDTAASSSGRTIVKRYGDLIIQTIPDPLAPVRSIERIKKGVSQEELLRLITQYQLTWEMIPSEHFNREVWEALLPHMPIEAMLRNLATMTRKEVLKPLGKWTAFVDATLRNGDLIAKSGLHPMKILIALQTYAAGKSVRGTSTWTPVRAITDALDEAFYVAFKNVTPSGKRIVLALDVSGSMASGSVAGIEGLQPRVAAAAMALITVATEPNYAIMAFSRGFIPLTISPRQRLDDVLRIIDGLPFDSTNCAKPMTWALEHGIDADAFVIYTDNETNTESEYVHGRYVQTMHPSQALDQYRAKTGIDAKLIVVATTSTEFTIARPGDTGMLDVCGFDSNAPSMISQFISGDL